MAKRVAEPVLPGFAEGEIAAHPTGLVREAFDMFNEYAKANKWVVTSVLDDRRIKAIRSSLPVYGGIEGWRKNLEKAARSDFLMGRVPGRDGRKTFKLDLDFLLQPKTRTRVIDGFYNGENDVPQTKQGETVKPAAINWRGQLERYRKGGWWPSQFGNRPEDPGPHLAPAEMIAEWRKRVGVTGMGHNGPHVETREEKLEASIRSYRKLGQWDRANKIEQELANLQKRPAVLVPAPDVAMTGMPPKSQRAAETSIPPMAFKGSHVPRPDPMVAATRAAAAGRDDYDAEPLGDDGAVLAEAQPSDEEPWPEEQPAPRWTAEELDA